MKTNALDKIPITPGTCEWCGKNCELEDVACSLSCEAQLHRIEATQGRTVLRVLKRWRKHSGRKGSPGEGLFTEVSELVSGFLRTDRIRRERHQAAQRLAAAMKPDPEPQAKPGRHRAVTAAPVTDEPGQFGDLDAGVPNTHDHGNRGFAPK